MREYGTCKSNEEVIFNAMLTSAHNPIESDFGRLKSRLLVLTKKMNFKLEKKQTMIYGCFALHNFCKRRHSVYINKEQVRTQLGLLKTNETQLKNLSYLIFSCVEGEVEVFSKTLTGYTKENF